MVGIHRHSSEQHVQHKDCSCTSIHGKDIKCGYPRVVTTQTTTTDNGRGKTHKYGRYCDISLTIEGTMYHAKLENIQWSIRKNEINTAPYPQSPYMIFSTYATLKSWE